MDLQYSLGINSLLCHPTYSGKTDVVFRVMWTMMGSDGTYFGAVCGSSLITYDPQVAFIEYDKLAPDDVVAWVKADIGPDQMAAIKASISAQIAAQDDSAVSTPPLPWAPIPALQKALQGTDSGAAPAQDAQATAEATPEPQPLQTQPEAVEAPPEAPEGLEIPDPPVGTAVPTTEG